MLAQLHDRVGELDRTAQVLQVAELLGCITDAEGARLAQLREQLPQHPSRPLSERLRQGVRVPEEDPGIERLWGIVRGTLLRVFPLELRGLRADSLEQAAAAEVRNGAAACLKLLAMKSALYVAADVPGGVLADDATERVILDRTLLAQPAPAVVFCIARALELLRSGHALVARLAFDDRMMLVELLNGLLEPLQERRDLATEFLRRLPPRAAEQVDEVAAQYAQQRAAGGAPQLAQRWLSAVERSADQVGLLACGEIGAALRMIALLSADESAIAADGTVFVPAVRDGLALVRFFLSPRYVRVRRQITPKA
jgi:hypothetical protein